jgi:type II secretory pathway pseudopilin PulG
VELLMVILIIGILAALLVVAAQSAVRKANQTRVVLEMGSLENALQAYKSQANSLPPDCGIGNVAARQNRIYTHVRSAFPKYVIGSYLLLQERISGTGTFSGTPAYNYSTDNGGTVTSLDIDDLDQAEALVFWLAGPPTPWDTSTSPATQIGTTKTHGFSANVRDPFEVGGSRLPGLFEFDQSRLSDVDGDGWLEYVPAGNPLLVSPTTGEPQMPPYVYFDAQTYTALAGVPYVPPATEWGQAIPYASAVSGTTVTWVHPDKFQIICAGLVDNNYGLTPTAGVFKLFPRGDNYAEVDYDNLTNFTSATLEDAMP